MKKAVKGFIKEIEAKRSSYGDKQMLVTFKAAALLSPEDVEELRKVWAHRDDMPIEIHDCNPFGALTITLKLGAES